MTELVVKQEVTVTHKMSEGDNPFSEAVASFAAMTSKLEKIATSIGKLTTSPTNETLVTSKTDDTTGDKTKSSVQPNVLSPIDTLNAKITELIKAITESKPLRTTEEMQQIKAITDSKLSNATGPGRQPLRTVEEMQQIKDLQLDAKVKSKAIDLQSMRDVANFRSSQKPTNEELEEQQALKSAQTWRKVAKGMALGGATAAVYQSGSVGATFGAEYNALNVSAANYGSFAVGQYNRQVDAVTGIASTGISSVTMSLAAAAAASGVGIPAAGLIMAGGAALNYGAQYLGGKSKAENELAVNEDIRSWRLRSAGLSGATASKIAGGGSLSEFQLAMRSKENAAYNTNSVEVFLNARRDVVGGMSTTNQAAYSTSVQVLAQKMGVDSMGLSRTVSNTMAITGKTDKQVRDDMQSNYNIYGGDPLANQNKINSLMMATSMGEAQATNLVNRYQYNDAMLQNKVNDSTVNPMNKFKANLYGMIYKNMTGLDIDSAEAKQRYLKAARSKEGSPSPEFEIYKMNMGIRGQNEFAADIGENTGSTPNKGAMSSAESQPISMGDYAQTMISALESTVLNVRIVDGNTQYTPAQPSTSGSDFTAQNKSYPAYNPAKNSTSQSSSKLAVPAINNNPIEGLIINGKQAK